jgi:hypothetical protein
VVKYSATTSVNTIRVKVAGENNGDLVALDAETVVMLQTYFDEVKPVGCNVIVTSSNPDVLRVSATIFFNSLVIRPDGTLVSNSNVRPVDDAITAFIDGIEFDGVLKMSALFDAIQAVNGVDDVAELVVEASYDGNSFVNITRQYSSVAGYMIIDPNTPLNTSLTYVKA